jgi:hypothetical protein
LTNPDTQAEPQVVPSAPTHVVCTRGDRQILVTFTPPVNQGASPVTRYTVVGSNGQRYTCQNSPVEIKGLENGTDYRFKVIATNDHGDSEESWPSDPCHPAVVPDPPNILSASVEDGRATVVFDPPEDDGGDPITLYRVLASNTINEDKGGQTAEGASSPLVVSDLTNGDSYSFTVVSINDVGESEESAPSALVIPIQGPAPDAPPPLPGAVTIKVSKFFNARQLQDELEEALDKPINMAWTRVNGMDPTDPEGILYIVPSDVDRDTVDSVIANHVEDKDYGVPQAVQAYVAVSKKIRDDPDAELTDEERDAAIRGMLIRMNGSGSF